MNILVTGGNFSNKGAELMLVSLVDAISNRFPNTKICVSPLLREEAKIKKLGILKLDFPLYHYGNSKMFQRLLKHPLIFTTYLKVKGIRWKGDIKLKDIDCVIDISGFAFGDKWGGRPLADLSFFAKFLRNKRKKFILMPQAFGPFTGETLQSAIKSVIRDCTLIFPRDEQSFRYVSDLANVNEQPKVILAPDITLTFKRKISITEEVFNRPFCAIVPNERMLDKASVSWQERYETVLERVVQKIASESDLHIVMLIHAQGASADYAVGQKVVKSLPSELHRRITLIVEEDPVRLKSIISKSTFIVGSRFHALASALSCDVPAIATSWLHKYEMLFKDFNCSEYSFSEPREELFERLSYLLTDEGRSNVIKELKQINGLISERSDQMWAAISKAIK